MTDQQKKIENPVSNDNERLVKTNGVVRAEFKDKKGNSILKDKLCIVGFAPSTLYLANDLDDSWEVWGINELYQLGIPEVAKNVGKQLDISKFTRWFEIHSRAKDKQGKAYCDDVNTETPQGKNHITNLNAMPFPVYMRGKDMKVFNDVKNAIAFPYKEIINLFGRKYFTNTIAWLLGFAVYEALFDCGIDVTKPCWEAIKGNQEKLKNFKFKKIAIYGVDMAVGWYKRSNGDDALQNEYASQRPSCEWMIGVIDGLRNAGVDVEVIIPQKSSLLKKFSLYGFEDLNEEMNQNRIDLLERFEFVESRLNQLRAQAGAIQGKANGEIQNINSQLLVMQGTKQEIEMQLSACD